MSRSCLDYLIYRYPFQIRFVSAIPVYILSFPRNPSLFSQNISYSMILCRISNSWSSFTSIQILLSHAGQFEGFCWVEPLWFFRSMINTGPPQPGHRIAALFPKGSQRTGNPASSIHLEPVTFDKFDLLLSAQRISHLLMWSVAEHQSGAEKCSMIHLYNHSGQIILTVGK